MNRGQQQIYQMSSPSPPSPELDPRRGKSKRTREACKRCRIKKAKCDGSSPCQRCRRNNDVCVFGRLQTPTIKRYPKGYIGLLETQQDQLVRGLQKLYQRIQEGTGWDGEPAKETCDGLPLTHDILQRLGILNPEQLTTAQGFEDDLDTMKQRLGVGDESYLTTEDFSSDTLSLDSYVSIPRNKSWHTLSDSNQHHFQLTSTSTSSQLPLSFSAPNQLEFTGLPFNHLDHASSGSLLNYYDPTISIHPMDYAVLENAELCPMPIAGLSKSWCAWDA